MINQIKFDRIFGHGNKIKSIHLLGHFPLPGCRESIEMMNNSYQLLIIAKEHFPY